MKDVLGYGIIGCGVIAPWHAGAVKNTSDVKLIAAADTVLEKAEKLKGEFGTEYAYADYRDMLARDDIDIVSICTPSGTHSDIAVDAARAGKHVMTEKPIDITLEKIDRMIEACREHNVKLGCIFQRRTSSLWQRIKRTVDEGRLGKMVLASAYVKWFRSQEYYDSAGWRGTWSLDGGGALMNQGVHHVDLLRWVMGPVDTVFGFAGPLARRIEVEDTAVASLKFKSGAFGTIEGTTSVVPGLEPRIEFHGDKGTIQTDSDSVVRWDVPGESRGDVNRELADKADGVGSGSADPTAISMRGHQVQIADFVGAVRENRQPMVDGAEARKSVELILAIYKSARTGRPVEL